MRNYVAAIIIWLSIEHIEMIATL